MSEFGCRVPARAIVDDQKVILRSARKTERSHFADMQPWFRGNDGIDHIGMHRHPRQGT